MTLHIGILQTDNVSPMFRDDHGDYPEMFQTLFGAVDDTLRFTQYDTQTGVPASIDCDVYLITGSKCSVYDDLPWISSLVDFIGEVLAAEKKIIGICFGHQLMAHFFGGRVAPAAAGWAVGVHTSEVVERKRWMGGMGEMGESIALLSSHKDQVQELPGDAELYLTNVVCPIAGFTVADQVITVQGHPEFNKPYARALMDMRQNMIGREVYENGVASLKQETEELVMAGWLLNFARGAG
jgi:GMP synthase-like glutamine amidotransferase